MFFWNRLRRIDQNMIRVLSALNTIQREIHAMSEAVDKLKAAVEANTNATQSVVTLVQTLAQQIKDASDDPAQVVALADSLMQNTQAIADAVTANTPAQNA